jgi:hypothetical protein
MYYYYWTKQEGVGYKCDCDDAVSRDRTERGPKGSQTKTQKDNVGPTAPNINVESRSCVLSYTLRFHQVWNYY